MIGERGCRFSNDGGLPVSCVFGIAVGDYSFVTVLTQRSVTDRYSTATCWGKNGVSEINK